MGTVGGPGQTVARRGAVDPLGKVSAGLLGSVARCGVVPLQYCRLAAPRVDVDGLVVLVLTGPAGDHLGLRHLSDGWLLRSSWQTGPISDADTTDILLYRRSRCQRATEGC